MNRAEEWRFFVEQLQESALKEYYSTREYELGKTRQAHLDDMMSNKLIPQQSAFYIDTTCIESELNWLTYNISLKYVDVILNGAPEKYLGTDHSTNCRRSRVNKFFCFNNIINVCIIRILKYNVIIKQNYMEAVLCTFQ